MKYRYTLFAILLFFLCQIPAINAEQRTALVIGNSNYESSRLKNPVNDATDIASTLKNLGFSVTLKTNVGKRSMEDSIKEFGRKLKGSEVGLFYYAGHGVQVKGNNYLIPIGAKIDEENDVQYEAVDLGRVLDVMESSKKSVNIVILDACRDNPYARSFRSGTRGLAMVSTAPLGAFISYSTSPGQVARDGTGRNSPYTKALLKYMQEPGMAINDIFMNVRQVLSQETGQVPWELSSLVGKFYFIQGKTDNVSKEVKVTPIKSDEAAFPSNNLDEEKAKIEAEWEKLRREKELLKQKETLVTEKKERKEQKNELAP